jgi:hypothetical protein
LVADDRTTLESVARSRRLPWYQVQHARIVLAVAAGEAIQDVAYRMECDPATVWRVCRRYEQGGLNHLLEEAPRPGRLPRIVFPNSEPDRVNAVCATDRQGA